MTHWKCAALLTHDNVSESWTRWQPLIKCPANRVSVKHGNTLTLSLQAGFNRHPLSESQLEFIAEAPACTKMLCYSKITLFMLCQWYEARYTSCLRNGRSCLSLPSLRGIFNTNAFLMDYCLSLSKQYNLRYSTNLNKFAPYFAAFSLFQISSGLLHQHYVSSLLF